MKIIGVMSGTSYDGVDLALAEITDGRDKLFFRDNLPCKKKTCKEYEGINVRLIGHHYRRFPPSLRKEISHAFLGDTERICRLHYTLGEFYASCIVEFLKITGITSGEVTALSVHGQTLYHIPRRGGRMGASLQIGNPAVIAEKTGILTISDFRSRDIAVGGEGAPLVPVSDYIIFRKRGERRCILNIGGISNITILGDEPDDTVGYDTGPGNALLDEAVRILTGGRKNMDTHGKLARKGLIIKELFEEISSDPFFRRRPPKSTGRERFGKTLVEDIIRRYKHLKTPDLLRTLIELTVWSIHKEIKRHRPALVIGAGGGMKNRFLVELLSEKLAEDCIRFEHSDKHGVPVEAREALSFAVLGYLTLTGRAGNLPSVTGAGEHRVLGSLTFP